MLHETAGFRTDYEILTDLNKKDNHLYTDRFNLIVIELNQEELASDEDIKYGIDKWVELFKSKTWEELNMVAQGNEYMASAVRSMNEITRLRKLLKDKGIDADN